jgi:uncharacterized protein YjbI with pentapeptide repeats
VSVKVPRAEADSSAALRTQHEGTPKMATSPFDATAWRDALLALNPWARNLQPSEDDVAFTAARRTATLKRFEDVQSCTQWSEAMIALKDQLENGGGSSDEALWTLLSTADFVEHKFGDDVNFSRAIFVGPAVFKRSLFPKTAFFEFAVFACEADFEEAVFSNRVSFTGAQFLEYAHFEDTKFKVDPDFTSVSFEGNSSFNGAIFSNGPASFCNVTFKDIAYFRGSSFEGWALFKGSTFLREADFSGATFASHASFAGTKFQGVARFTRPASYSERVRFLGPADFSEASFAGAAYFEDVDFCALATFDSLDSTAIFSLASSRFKVVPSLFGATFRALRFDNVQTPRNNPFGWTQDKDAPARFRELRRRAIESKDPERELEFFAQEIRTSRFHAERLPAFIPRLWEGRFYFGWVYGALSDYGRSIWRPVLSWLALLLLCATIYLGANGDMQKARVALHSSGMIETILGYATTTRAALTNPPPCADRALSGETNPVIEAYQLSLHNALVFESSRPETGRRTLACLYGYGASDPEKNPRMSPVVSTVSTLQSLASGVLIFLLLLAARNLLRLR